MANSTKQTRDIFSTRYVIEGTEEYVASEIARLVRDYPTAGYATGVLHRTATTAVVRRDNSCD